MGPQSIQLEDNMSVISEETENNLLVDELGQEDEIPPETGVEITKTILVSSAAATEPTPSTSSTTPQLDPITSTLHSLLSMVQDIQKESSEKEASFRTEIHQQVASHLAPKKLNIKDLPAFSDFNPWRKSSSDEGPEPKNVKTTKSALSAKATATASDGQDVPDGGTTNHHLSTVPQMLATQSPVFTPVFERMHEISHEVGLRIIRREKEIKRSDYAIKDEVPQEKRLMR
ncbi:uncharacterized protein [Palaemon carinicauda]|uniref:uncharacterized protein n=1 Tax=Palaemon carinicauda TaxID=392227 RepID=UPI0035B632E8